MQQTVSWKNWLFIGVLQVSLLAVPACGQSPDSTTTPPAGADAKSYVAFGITNGAKGDLPSAIKAFNQAISLDPKFAPAYYNRGFAYALQNKQDQAIADYTQAIQLDPNYKEAYYQRGSLQGQKGNFNDAINDFSSVIKIDPKYAPAFYNRGHVQYFKGDLDNAFDQINQALALNSSFPFAYFIRGLIRHAQGHREEALADFQKGSGLGFPYAAFWVWITEMEGGQPIVARKDLVDSLNNPEYFKPDDWPSQIGSYLLERITQTELMAKAKAGDPNGINGRLCEAWFYVGMHNLLAGEPKEAKDGFAAAVATGAKGSEEFVEANRALTQVSKQ